MNVLCEKCYSILFLIGHSCLAIPFNTSGRDEQLATNSFKALEFIPIGESILFECRAGYNLIGNGSAVCQHGPVWLHNATCEIVECQYPPDQRHAKTVIRGNNFSFTQSVSYECEQSHIKISGDMSLRCAANGSWTGEPIVCEAGEVGVCEFLKLCSHEQLFGQLFGRHIFWQTLQTQSTGVWNR